ncbi:MULTISPECIES: lysozyme [Symbiopectobacterium]|uniref:lysozyme n=1 Tax=Symbiopectobacterium TaxID=801 RepID=UPI001A1F642F|nr:MULTISPECIES: lysozyme [Symbiopectobacterium]MBG6248379.1 lysozyme [Candidatus Symbiopectobacterium sp. PLON1]MBT9430291.1 lysozyme [Candidatus Symbiopectobacterium endolongispinus]
MSKASKLSAAMLALIAAGATAHVMMAQFQTEKESVRMNAYPDGGGIWTICGGVTWVDGKPVVKGMKLTTEQCSKIDAIEQQKALDWVDRNVKVPLTETQKVGIASFCPWNIGPGNSFPSTFYRKLNAGDLMGACKEIKRWIWDGGKDCRIRSNNCYGQIERRDQESELSCWGLGA